MFYSYLLIFARNYMRGPKCPSEARMDNKIVIVTGANNGIGFETTKNLLLRGKQCSLLNFPVPSSSNAVFFSLMSICYMLISFMLLA